MWSIEDILSEVTAVSGQKTEGRILSYDLKFKPSKHGMIIEKITSISNKFNRPIATIIYFLKTELSSVVKHDAVSDQVILSTKASSVRLRGLFTKFIAEFITCNDCKKHDTILNNCLLTCTGCGAQRITKTQQ